MEPRRIPLACTKALSLSLTTPQLARNAAVTEILNSATQRGAGSAYCLTMGSTSQNLLCKTCFKAGDKCQNHIACMSLPCPVNNPESVQTIVKVLRSVCFYCSRLLIPACLPCVPEARLEAFCRRPCKITAEDAQALRRFLQSRSERANRPKPCEAKEVKEEAKEDESDGDSEGGESEDEEEEEAENAEEQDEGEEEEEEEDPTAPDDPWSGVREEEAEDEEEKEEVDEDKEEDEDEEKNGSRHARALLRSGQTQLDRLLLVLATSSGPQRLKQIAELSERVRKCSGRGGCGREQPAFAVVANRYISVSTKDQKAHGHSARSTRPPPIREKIPVEDEEISGFKLNSLNALCMYSTLVRIPDDDLRLLGFRPERSRPENLFFSVLPISPPCIRPTPEGVDGEELRGHNDLTRKINRISKLNSNLKRHAAEFQEHFEQLVQSHCVVPASIRNELTELELFLTDLDMYWLQRYGCHYNETQKMKSLPTIVGKTSVLQKNVATKSRKPVAEKVTQQDHERLMRVALREFEFGYYQLQDEIVSMFVGPTKTNGKQPRGGVQMHSFRKRLNGKPGLLRQAGTGRRRVRSARCVISPNPHSHISWVGVPQQIAMVLTYGEAVTKFNVHRLTRAVRLGPGRYPGANLIHRKTRSGEWETIDLRFLDVSKIVLQYGWVVERHMVTGDPLLMNRQPSLHRMNMGMFFVEVQPHIKVFEIPLAITPLYGADFDGDEMTAHSLNSPEARAEALLMLVELHISSPKNGLPIANFVYDSVLGIYLLTGPDVQLDLETMHLFLGKLNPRVLAPGRDFEDVLTLIDEEDKDYQDALLLELNAHVDAVNATAARMAGRSDELRCCELGATREVLAVHERDLPLPALYASVFSEEANQRAPRFAGTFLFSCILPPDLYFTFGKEDDPDQPLVRVQGGRLTTGRLYKAALTAMLDAIRRLHGTRHAANFIYNVQTLANEFLEHHTCSLSMKDFQVSRTSDICDQAVKWADAVGMPQNTRQEELLCRVLGEAQVRAGKLALAEMLHQRNDAVTLVRSGTKGNTTMLVEIASAIGQQWLESERLKMTLPMYSREELLLHYVRKQGFIQRSYSSGMNATDFYLASIPGRANQTDTTQKTCNTGYFQRKFTKSMEGDSIGYDRTLRTSAGELLSVNFGGDGFDSMHVQMTPLRLLGMSVDQVKAEHATDPAISDDVLRMLLQLRRVFLTLCVKQERKDLCVPALGSLRMFAEVALFTPLRDAKEEVPLSAREIWQTVTAFVATRITPQHAPVQPLAFLATFFEEFSPAKLKGCSARTLDRGLWFVGKLHDLALIEPLTRAGLLAGQSIGEPTTQLTLKTCHVAGNKMSLGVGRIREIVNYVGTESMETPHMVFDMTCETRTECERFCQRLRGTTLLDFVVDSRCGPCVPTTALEDRQALICRSLMSFKREWTIFTLRFTLKRQECLSRDLTPRILCDRIHAAVLSRSTFVAATVANSDAHDWYIRFDIPATDQTLQTIRTKLCQLQKVRKSDADSVEFPLVVLKMRMLECAIVCGSPLIEAYEICETDFLDLERVLEHGLRSPLARVKTFRVQTKGSDLNFFLSQRHPRLRTKTCLTNSIKEVEDALGVAAARKLTEQQFNEVLSGGGSQVHSRHMSMTAQKMTLDGPVQAFSRYGVIKHLSSVIARAAFEVTIPMLMEGATFGERDLLQGITENIIVGQQPPVGTAQVKVMRYEATPFDIWQRRAVFAANKRRLRQRAVRHTETRLEPADLALLAKVRSREPPISLRPRPVKPLPTQTWRPREPDWGNFSLDVLRAARCRADLFAPRAVARRVALRPIFRFVN